MKKILWLSRHVPQPEQIRELETAFGEVILVQEAVTVQNASEVKSLMQERNCDELVAVLPVNLIADLTRMGIKPLRAVMNRQLDDEGNATFTHSHFERVERVEIVSHPITEEVKR